MASENSHNCSELKAIQESTSTLNHNYKQLLNKFEMLQNLIIKYKNLPDQRELYTCSTCQVSGNYSHHRNGLFLCLHCTYYGCNGIFSSQKQHFREHNQEHIFGINTQNLKLFCFHCNDYILSFNKDESPAVLDNINHQMMFGLFKLNNFGASCYMNSIIQSLLHNPYFNNYFVSNHHYKECVVLNEKECLSCLLVDLHALFFSGNSINDGAVINFLKMTLNSNSELKHIFNGYTQQDAHEFWQFLINRLHMDHTLNGKKKLSKYENYPNIENCNCITHITFQGVLQNNIECSKCKAISTNHEEFLDLSLNVVDKNEATLKDCLYNFFGKEHIKDYKYTCGACANISNSITKHSFIANLPLTLCIQLKRFKQLSNGNLSKINSFIEFDKYLDMGPYSSNEKNSIVYELNAVVVHEGNNFDTGHYVVSVNMGDGIWFKFNDHKYTKISEKTVLNQTAYLLFYTLK